MGTALVAFIAMSDLSMHPDYSWNYDLERTTLIASDELDFLSVVLHEIGHALGFTSGIDDPGWLQTVQTSDAKKGNLKIKNSESNIGSPLRSLPLF